MSINLINNISPYLPDIFIKNDIYTSADNTDYNTTILLNSTIFIFNISNVNTQLYDDPNYLLYGVMAPDSIIPFNNLPPLYFFNKVIDVNGKYLKNYEILYETYETTPQLLNLLNEIGYDSNNINFSSTATGKTGYFHYAELLCYDKTTSSSVKVLYFYFWLTDNITNETNITNYNYYNSTVYYINKYWNVLIYPYFDSDVVIPSLDRNINITYDPDNYLSNSKNNLKPLNFNNTDIIRYIEKIDYKYMEKSNILLDNNTKIDLLKNYSINIKNFKVFFDLLKEDTTILISNNEINKLYFENLDYENNHLNTYTLTKLNNNHINNNNSYSNVDKKYSFSMNNKFSNLKLNTKYCCYNYDIINIPSIYQITKNYNINSYIDITKQYLSENNDLLFVVNTNLYKTLLFIDPFIINRIYLSSSDVSLIISNLYQNNNTLIFGSDVNKMQLYLVDKLIYTDTYYINKYKIVYFTIYSDGTNISYIIYLSIIYYNGNNINITNLDVTANTQELSFITYTNSDCSVTLAPTISANQENILHRKILENTLYDIKDYSFNIDYSSISETTNYFNNYYSNHFYFFISNFKPNLITIRNTTQIIPNNQLDIIINKVNNLIKNIININRNTSNYKFDIRDSKMLLMLSIVLDSNIDNKYIYNYSYFPNIIPETTLPNTINIYKMNNYQEIDNKNNLLYDNNLVQLPAGNYKVFNYYNNFSNYNFTPVNIVNDNLVKSINTYSGFYQNNFCLMVKLPDNINVDDDFYYNNYTKNYYNDNYSSNIAYNKTSMYLVICDVNQNIYVSTTNIIYGLELFNTYNDISETNTGNRFKIKINLLINNYINFYQMNFYSELYNVYSEQDNLILNTDKLYQNLYPITYLKDVVFYDFIRFNNNYDLTTINTQYSNFDINIALKVYWRKYFLNKLNINKNRIIFIFNSIKNLFV